MRAARSPVGRLWGRVREWLAPLGSRSALSLRGPLLIVPVASVAQVATDQAVYGGAVASWLAVSGVGLAVVLCGMAVARWLLGARIPAPSLIVLIFVALGMARSLVAGLLAVTLGLVPAVEVDTMLTVGLVTGPALLLAGAYLVCRHDAHRQLVADLAARRASLIETERRMDSELARATAELADTVRTTLAPPLAALDAAFRSAAGGGGTAPVVLLLGDLIEQWVRPLSHELADGGQAPPAPPPDVAVARPRPRLTIPARFRIGDGLRPGPASLLGGLVAVTPAAHDLGPLAATAYVAAVVAWSWGVLALFKRVLGRVELRTPLTVAAVIALHVALTPPLALLFAALAGGNPGGDPLARAVIWALIGGSLILIALVDAHRTATEAALAATEARLTASLGVVRRRVGLTRRRIAHLLHGSLQGALFAAAMRLAEAPTASPELTASVQGDIERALRKLDVDTRRGVPALLDETVAEIIGTWGEQRSIEVKVDPEASVALADQADASEAVALVVCEAITNALRHGRARSVRASVMARTGRVGDPAAFVEIAVDNDGADWPSDSSQGLGTATFNELCHSWWHTSGEGRVRFGALITLTRRPLPSTRERLYPAARPRACRPPSTAHVG